MVCLISDKELEKISIICLILGLFFLTIISKAEYIEFNEVNISDSNKIKLTNRITDYQIYEKYIILKIPKYDEYTIIINKKNFNKQHNNSKIYQNLSNNDYYNSNNSQSEYEILNKIKNNKIKLEIIGNIQSKDNVIFPDKIKIIN